MSISQNIVQLKASLPANVTLVAMSKFHPAEALMEAYNAGQRVFGESSMAVFLLTHLFIPNSKSCF